MNCPNCTDPMTTMPLEGVLGSPISVQTCTGCQGLWFELFKSLQLAPASTLKLMKFIGENSAAGRYPAAAVLHCPICQDKLLLTHDWQRNTPFTYWRCEKEHGRFIGFFDFLREKDYIHPLSPQQITELRKNIQFLNCHNCGAPIDLAKGSSCEHCHSPVSMLDMQQPQKMLSQLKDAASGKQQSTPQQINFTPAFHHPADHPDWWSDVSSNGLVHAGLKMVSRWLSGFGE
jgi:hypothetical protein